MAFQIGKGEMAVTNSKSANAMDWVAGVLPGLTANPPAAPQHDVGEKAGPVRKIRVAQTAAGTVATAALTAILADPTLELVSVWGVSPELVGPDAGELVGVDNDGVSAVESLEAALAAGPDVVVLCGTDVGGEDDAVRDAVFALERGVNVITTALPQLVDPSSAPAEQRRPLKDAAVVGQVSFVATGPDSRIADLIAPLVAAGPGVQSAGSLGGSAR